MPVLDWNSTAAWLGIFTTLAISIITPAITTYLTNKFQLRLKEKELLHAERSDLYTKKYYVYEGFLQNVGKCLQLHSQTNITAAGTFLYELYLFLPSEHWPLLDSLANHLEDSLWSEAHGEFIAISKILSVELKASEANAEK